MKEVLVCLFLLIAPSACFSLVVYNHEEAKWKGVITEYQLQAEQRLKVETEAILERERNLQNKLNELETSYHEKSLELDNANKRNLELVRSAGGLRDKGKRTGKSNTTSKDSTSGGNNETGSFVLSDETTQFLLNLTRDADQVCQQLKLCQDYLRSLAEQN